MITQFITAASLTFSPFLKSSKVARSVLAQFPPGAFKQTKITVKQLPRYSTEKQSLAITFTDGRVLELDPEKVKMNDVDEEVNRHSRVLQRAMDLKG